jgi:hypothetical protein
LDPYQEEKGGKADVTDETVEPVYSVTSRVNPPVK